MDAVNEMNLFTSVLRLCKRLDKSSPDWDKPFAEPLSNSDEKLRFAEENKNNKQMMFLYFCAMLKRCNYNSKEFLAYCSEWNTYLVNDAEITSVSKINAAKGLKTLTSFRKEMDDSVFDEMELQNILNLPSGKIMHTALITNEIGQKKTNNRPSKTFRDRIITKDEKERDCIMETLNTLIKGRVGEEVVKVIKAAIKISLILKPTESEVRAAFGDIGAKSGYNRQMKIKHSENELSSLIEHLKTEINKPAN